MTVEYGEKIVQLCKKYGIECDDSMPYGILDAEYELDEARIDINFEGGELE